jgi:hypothetical protein
MAEAFAALFDKAAGVIQVIDAHPTGALILVLLILAVGLGRPGPGQS